MNTRLVIGVCTRERPQMLAQCLKSLAAQETCIKNFIVVADNNSSPAMQAETARLVGMYDNAIRIAVPTQGIATARNAILDMAVCLEAEAVAFIDDDEWAEPSWVRDLWLVTQSYDCDVVYAPVRLHYEPVAVSWTDGRREKKYPPLHEGCRTEHASTCNVLIARSIWGNRDGDLGLRFDTDYDLTGGEDSAFFSVVHRRGKKMIWSNMPIVHETVPASRQRFRYFFTQRVQRGMATEAMKRGGYLNIPQIKPGFYLNQAVVEALRLAVVAFDGTRAKKERIMIVSERVAFSWGQFLGALGRKSRFYKNVHGR